MAKRIYPFLPISWLTSFEYDNKKYVKSIACPVLVAHSRSDDIIPFDEGREIFDAAPKTKQFLELRGGHNDGFMISDPTYADGLRSFIHGNLE
jgi:hypothetical protein